MMMIDSDTLILHVIAIPFARQRFEWDMSPSCTVQGAEQHSFCCRKADAVCGGDCIELIPNCIIRSMMVED